MHILQPKHRKLGLKEAEKLVTDLNISTTQLPKIRIIDPAIPEGCEIGDIVEIERIINSKKTFYFRVVTV